VAALVGALRPDHADPARAGAVEHPAPLAPIAPPHPSRIRKAAASPEISLLPAGSSGYLALTVDDGTSSAVVGSYLNFAHATGARLTFFPNGANPSWTQHAATLRPLIESGQVQIGNHTWSHPNLTQLTDAQIAGQINRNESFFQNTFGVSGRPFLRPPYGAHDERVDRIAADLGYTTIVMWWGSLGDSSVLTPAQITANEREWFKAGHIVIGHANHPGVTHTFGEMARLLRERHLQTVTLNDVFSYAR
jgi:peptidoglycan/xylan/chitin deacetylase (PgdA/CDA1 family)